MTEKWYSRPVFFVRDTQKALSFYTDALGFTQSWDYYENTDSGSVLWVTQVNRGSDCEIILNRKPERAGHSRLFISLENDERAVLLEQLATRNIATEKAFWGFPVLIIRDPDGNELLIPENDD